MVTTRELIDDLAKRKALFDVALKGTDLDEGGMNPVVAEALASGAPSGGSPAVREVAESLASGVGPVAPSPAPAERPVIPAPSAGADDTGSFYDMLLRNDAYRLANKEAFERNERANAARTRIAAVTDALASLGNLVGTTQGAFSQPQTYQTPFVTEQVEADRKQARTLAKALQDNDQSLRLAKARMDASESALDRQLAVQQAITDRSAMNNKSKMDLEDKRQAGKMEIEKFKQGGRVSLKQMDIDYKQDRDALQAALRQSGINISRDRLDEMIRHNQTMEEIQEKGGGSVGSYRTVIIRDELGREVERIRIGGSGSVPEGYGGGGGGRTGGFDLGGSGKVGGFS